MGVGFTPQRLIPLAISLLSCCEFQSRWAQQNFKQTCGKTGKVHSFGALDSINSFFWNDILYAVYTQPNLSGNWWETSWLVNMLDWGIIEAALGLYWISPIGFANSILQANSCQSYIRLIYNQLCDWHRRESVPLTQRPMPVLPSWLASDGCGIIRIRLEISKC